MAVVQHVKLWPTNPDILYFGYSTAPFLELSEATAPTKEMGKEQPLIIQCKSSSRRMAAQ